MRWLAGIDQRVGGLPCRRRAREPLPRPAYDIRRDVYFPTTPLQFAGGQIPTGAAAYTIVVADTLTLTGTSTSNDDFSGLIPGGSPLKAVALAE